jgi:hypothetical protein
MDQQRTRQDRNSGRVANRLTAARWHGAALTTTMTHIAIQEYLDGKAADWMEKVSDEQYRK